MPKLTLGSDDDSEDGRMIPTLSIDQFGAELSRWFGLSSNEIAAVFPNNERFDLSQLGIFSG